MAVQTTEEFKNGGATSYAITIEYLQESDIKVRIGGALQTYVASSPSAGEYTVSGTTVTLGAQAAAGTGNVHIYRETDVNTAAATFAAGSSIRAADLNAIHDMARFAATEHRNKIITANIKEDAVTSTEIADGTIVNANINASAAIDNTKIADGLLKSGITVNSANIVDGSIVDGDVSNSAAIAGTKISPNFGSQVVQTSGNIVVGGTVDGRDVAADGTKLDTVESGATADQTNAEIKTAYEANANTNEFSDAEQTKLAGIETGATADQTNAEIKTAYEANANTNEFSDAEQTKLAGIEAAATADQTAAEIKTLLQSDKLTNSEIATGTLDNRYYTETELDPSASAGQNVLDARYYTETEAEAKFLRQDSSETIASGATWSNSDAFVATTAAINARIIDLVDDVGGFTVIATELVFPNTNPQGATGQSAILSIGSLTQAYTPSGTTVTIANGTVGNSTVTITGVPSVLPQGFGILVESTSTLNTYTFHRLVPKATEVTTVASNITNIVNAGANVVDINNFADLYQISSSAPTQRADGTALQEGDLWYDSSNDNLLVYTGSAFAIITPSQSVLDDVAIVSGAITYSEDLGLITNAASTGSSNGSLDIVADAIEDEVTFAITVSSGAYLIDGVSKPALTLYKGWTYTFDVSDSSNGSHPLRFQSGGSAYNTGVTVTGTQGTAGAKVQLVVPESQPTSFQYYCTNHSGMGNTITVKDDPIKTVSDNIVKIIAASDNSTNINAVQANQSNINAAVSNASNINAAVSNASNINAAVTNATNITAVADNETNINAVQANASNINAAVSNASNINAVVSNAANINTVAGNNSNITAVGSNISNVNSVHSNASNINSAVSNASNINSVAGSIANVNTTASNIANVNNFASTYQISSSNPSQDGGGNSLAAGDLYFNTSSNELRVYNGSTWQGGVTATGNLAGLGANTFTGNQTVNANIIVSGTVDGVDIAAFKTSFDNLSTDIVNDSTPQLGGALDGQNNNLSNIGTIDGTNLQLDFGSIA